MNVKKMKAALTAKPKEPKTPKFLSTGSTLLNLALTGDPNKGFATSSYALLVGDSRSGKTFLALQAMAEASVNPAFDKYRLVYFDAERGARMDIARFFGKKLKDRLEWIRPKTLDEYYFLLDDMHREGPVITCLDSMDDLQPQADADKFAEQKSAFRKGKETTGTYGTAKAKQNSAGIRTAHNSLEDHNSIMLVIAQTRDNIGFGAQYNPKTRGGGHALTFYATFECWFSIKESLKRTVRGKPRKIGSVLQVKVKKNRETGRELAVELHHYPTCGFDDVGSQVQWLVDEKFWTESKGRVASEPIGLLSGTLDQVVEHVESEGLEKELRIEVASAWAELEEACAVQRKSRYNKE